MPEGKKKGKVTVKVNVTPKNNTAARKHKKRAAEKRVKRVVKQMDNMQLARQSVKTRMKGVTGAAVAKLGKNTKEAKQLTKVLEALAIPREATPIKMGTSKYGGDPTGACNPYEQRPVLFNTTASGSGDFDRTNCAFAFRSLFRSFVYSYAPTALSTYTGQDQVAITPGNWSFFNPGALQVATSFAPHGQYLYPGRHGVSDEHRGFWVDGGAKITVSVDPATLPVAGLAVNLTRSNGREWKPTIQGQLISGSVPPATFVTSGLPAGYYSFEFSTVDPSRNQALAANFLISVSLEWDAAVGVCYGHLSVPDLENQFGALDAVRVTAVSLMLTNNSAAILQQGTLCGVQFNEGTMWSEAVDFNHFTTNRKAKILPSNNGMYGFLKPTSEEDFDYLKEYERYVQGETGERLYMLPQLCDAAFDIITPTGYIGIAFDVARPGGVFPQGVTAYWTRAYGLEFLTNDQWRSLSRSTLSPDIIEIALHLLSETQQWHANDFHLGELLSQIKNFAKNVLNGIIEYGPTVLKGATMLAPLLL